MSIQEKAEIKQLMADISQIQAKIKSASNHVKVQSQQLVKAINQLQIEVIKNKDKIKFKTVKNKTRDLFELQLSFNFQRQQYIREQINKLLLIQKKYHLISKKTPTKLNKVDQRLLQQLIQLHKTKKEEFIQSTKETKEIQERAFKKHISLTKSLVKPASNKKTNTNYPNNKRQTEIDQANLTERAKTEAEKLIIAVSQGKVEKNIKGITNHKTQEISKMIDEINQLQMSADQGVLSDNEVDELEDRVRAIEEKQKHTREQINQLTQAKIKYELAINRSSEIRDQAQQRREQDAQLQEELNSLISQKENEQQLLLTELKQIKKRSEQESALLKAQRDAARALAAEKRDNDNYVKTRSSHKKQSLIHILLIFLAILLLVAGIGAGTYYFLFYKYTSDNEKITNTAVKAAIKSTTVEKPITKVIKTASKKELKVAPIKFFRDKLNSGGYGPKMVQLPAGSFIMGSKPQLPYKGEQPLVTIELKGFSIGRYEVTLKEYRYFTKRTQAKLPDISLLDNDLQPIINVNFNEAVAYTKWLTDETGNKYHLPSEREWAYAAKAGSNRHVYWWGNHFKKLYANCSGCGSQWDNKSPAPVGQFKANNFGLYDVIGNVSEWTRTCYHPNYRDAPVTGQIWERKANCHYRMVRSSAYNSYKKDIRTAKRIKLRPQSRSGSLGFRVVRVD